MFKITYYKNLIGILKVFNGDGIGHPRFPLSIEYPLRRLQAERENRCNKWTWFSKIDQSNKSGVSPSILAEHVAKI